MAPDVPDPPAPPAEPKNYEAVSGKRGEERKRQLAAYGSKDTILTGAQGATGKAPTGKTVLGG
jgi:hypothetical protein